MKLITPIPIHLANLFFLGFLAISSHAVAADETWTCKAEGIREFRYDGSGWAYIHLNAYQTGGSYQVKLNEDRTEATGKTKDGSAFTCVRAR